MGQSIGKGDKVTWNWGNGQGEGTVEKTYDRKITRKIKGEEITRNGSKDDPALYIKAGADKAVLKLSSEIHKA